MEGDQQTSKPVININSTESWVSHLHQSISNGTPEIASKYEVKAMPTYLLMKEGVVGRLVGANPDEIKKRIETLLQSNTDFVV